MSHNAKNEVLTCVHCGNKCKHPGEQFAGQQAKCKKCLGQFVVPQVQQEVRGLTSKYQIAIWIVSVYSALTTIGMLLCLKELESRRRTALNAITDKVELEKTLNEEKRIHELTKQELSSVKSMAVVHERVVTVVDTQRPRIAEKQITQIENALLNLSFRTSRPFDVPKEIRGTQSMALQLFESEPTQFSRLVVKVAFEKETGVVGGIVIDGDIDSQHVTNQIHSQALTSQVKLLVETLIGDVESLEALIDNRNGKLTQNVGKQFELSVIKYGQNAAVGPKTDFIDLQLFAVSTQSGRR